MKNFTLIKAITLPSILLFIMFSNALFGQMKKANPPSVAITFQVDMTYQVAKGAFNPLVDFVDIAGTMNGGAGSSPMAIVGSSLVFEIVYTLDSNSIQEYKFRINGLWATSEFPNGGPDRMYLVPNHPDTVKSVYTDYEPGTVPMTFKCNMAYQMKMGRFDKADDYLDFAGNINNWGAYDVLFDKDNDSIYEFNINIDTNYIFNQTKVEFKFRINGDWNNAEVGPNRSTTVQDTINGFKNMIEVWYNDQDPNIAAPPFVYNVAIQGYLSVGETLTGSYTYEDLNGDPEGKTSYRWFRADSITQINPEAISGASTVNYVPTSTDAGKYLAFMVTPAATSGVLLIGESVIKWADHKVYGVGFNENSRSPVRFYPNPVRDFITIENMITVEKIEIFSVVGKSVFTQDDTKTDKILLDVTNLKPGVYFIKFYNTDKGTSTSKFIKN